MLSIYLQGLSLGLAYVAPHWYANLFVINSAMSQKLRRAIITAFIVTWLNRICGAVIVLCGVKLLGNLVQMFLV